MGSEMCIRDSLYAVLECARYVGILLQPIVPDLSARILSQLNLAPTQTTWIKALTWGQLTPGGSLPKPEPVMQRLELDAPL